jgi:hypothetical protein
MTSRDSQDIGVLYFDWPTELAHGAEVCESLVKLACKALWERRVSSMSCSRVRDRRWRHVVASLRIGVMSIAASV